MKKLQRNAILLIGLLAGLITITIYLPALQNGFINYDDNFYVYENKNIQSIDYGLLKWSLTSRVMGLWHPLSFITFAFDYAAWGLDPKGYHLANVLFHVLNTILVYIISVRLILICNPKFHKKGILAGFVTAFLFGIHPLHVESVAWVAERKDVLCAFFYLFSLLAYLRYISPGAKRHDYALCLIFYMLALMSKPMALSLPMVLLVLDYYPLMRLKMGGNLKKVFIEKLPFFILGALALLITLFPQISGISAKVAPHPIAERMLVFVHGCMFYLQKILFPTHLAPLYPCPVKVSFLDFEYLGSMALFILISAFCINFLKRSRLFFCLWLYYIISLLPVAGVSGTPHSMADRYAYLPSIAPFMFIGFVFIYICERGSKRTFIITFIFLLLSGYLVDKTVKQIRVWHDPMTLWTHEIRVLPKAAAGHGMMGLTYKNVGNYQLALREANKSIELDKNYSVIGYNFRGTLYYHLGNYQQAINDFNRAIELKSDNASAFTNRGYVYCKMGLYMQSIKDLKKAIEFDPVHREAYNNLGMVYSQMGDNKQALYYYKKAADLGF